MSTPLTLVVHITAKPGKAEEVKAYLISLLAPTREEKGCEYYDFYTDNEDDHKFHFVEAWTTVEDWQAHNDTPHIKAFIDYIDEAIDDVGVVKLTKVDA